MPIYRPGHSLLIFQYLTSHFLWRISSPEVILHLVGKEKQLLQCRDTFQSGDPVGIGFWRYADLLEGSSRSSNCCIANSGVIQGPPLADHPGQLCMVNAIPSRSASRIACCFNATHSSLKYCTGPFGIPVPTSKLKPLPLLPASCFKVKRNSFFSYVSIHPEPIGLGMDLEGGCLKSTSSVEMVNFCVSLSNLPGLINTIKPAAPVLVMKFLLFINELLNLKK
jgi:hypothetical protein